MFYRHGGNRFGSQSLVWGVGVWSVVVASFCLVPLVALAQVEGPNVRELFREDERGEEEARRKRVQEILKSDAPGTGDLDVKAPTVEFDQEANAVQASGGVLVSFGDLQLQAESAQVEVESRDATLEGDVLVTSAAGTISADSAEFNLNSETGDFEMAEFTLEDGSYGIEAERALKVSENQYKLFDCGVSTCHCPDGESPWSIRSSRANITREGYAHTYNSYLDFSGVPLFFTPYFAFPVKEERQSGLLIPEFGYSNRDGFRLHLPLFLVLDDQTDVTLRPFIETETRYGTGLDVRRAFSRRHEMDSRFIYSNESPRDDALRGTVVDRLFDPTFDENRFGGYYRHNWSSERDALVPMSVILDGHYVSDDLFLREIEDDAIGRRTDRYVTSRAVARAMLGSFVSAELSGEYNQAIETDDDLVLQRLPEFTLSSLKSFRPFGFNPYGLKVVTKTNASVVRFDRDTGFDGTRLNLNPSISLPFHYKNYLSSELEFFAHQTFYELDDNVNPTTGSVLDSSNDRTIFSFGWTNSTALERVYQLPPENLLTTITGLGSRNQNERLRRVKHTVEPYVRYNLIPSTSQDDLPLFDSFDRIRDRSLVTYGVRSSLFGRFVPVEASDEDITEFLPELDDLPSLGNRTALGDLDDLGSLAAGGQGFSIRRGQVRELVTFGVHQSYDYFEDRRDRDPGRDEFSDIGTDIGFFPSQNFGLRFDSNFDSENLQFSSWSALSHLKDDRGDAVRTRFTFIDNSVSQLEGNLELVLTDQLKVGYYTRYDDRSEEFIENRVALRIASYCDCWHLDLGWSEGTNPDRGDFTVNFTFVGLGDISQDIGLQEEREKS